MKNKNLLSGFIAIYFLGTAVAAQANSSKFSAQNEIDKAAAEIEFMMEAEETAAAEDNFVKLKKNKNYKKSVASKKPAIHRSKLPITKRAQRMSPSQHTIVAKRQQPAIQNLRASNTQTLRYSEVDRSLDLPNSSLFTLAPVAGVTNTTLESSSQYDSFKDSLGYVAGLDILVGYDNLQAETGLHFAQRGTTQESRQGFNQYDAEFTMTYLEVPLALKYKFNFTDKLNVFGKAGVTFAYLMDSTVTVSNRQNQNFNFGGYQMTNEDAKNSFNELETRGLIAGGVAYKFMKKLSIFSQLEFQKSLTKTSSGVRNISGTATEMEINTMSLGLSAGLFYEI